MDLLEKMRAAKGQTEASPKPAEDAPVVEAPQPSVNPDPALKPALVKTEETSADLARDIALAVSALKAAKVPVDASSILGYLVASKS